MREIKFRAWDGKFMLAWGNISGGIYYGSDFGELSRDPMYKVMQFTGLKDKNGVEIYEGDIVTLGGWKRTGEVYYANCRYQFDDMGGSWNPLEIEQQDRLEVIGNIYETPELLKEG